MTIVSMFKNNNEVDNLRDSGYAGADFEVARSPVLYKTDPRDYARNTVEGKNVYFRTDTGESLAIHGDRYKPVTHKEMIDTARNVLERSNLNLEGIQEDIRVGDNGSTCFVRHFMPSHEIKTPDGDTAQMTMLHINSFNSVWPYQATAGAHQSACLNHQVFVSGAAAIYKARHTNKLNVDHGAAKLNGILGMLDKQNEIWAEWNNIRVPVEQAFKIFAEAAGSSFALGKLKEGISFREIMTMPTAYNNNNLRYLMTQFDTCYVPRMGNTYWAVYNALTDWSTHSRSSRKNAVDVPVAQYKKAEKVQKVINNFPFAKAA